MIAVAVVLAAVWVLASLVFGSMARTRSGTRREALVVAGCSFAVAASVAALAVAIAAVTGGSAAAWAAWVSAVVGALATGAAALALGRARGSARPGRVALRVAVVAVAVAIAGLVGLAVTLIAVGRLPERGERSFAAGAVAGAVAGALAAAALVARGRLWSARIRRQTRLTPAGVVERFGERATGSLPDAELDRQLVESLRSALQLRRAEIWVLQGDRLVCTTAVPAWTPEPVPVGSREREALNGVAVAGEAWAGMWLPALLAGRRDVQLRLAPARHAGAVLGLVVTERAAGDPAFEEVDGLALADLGRRLGAVLSNRRLDVALQDTLDDLRRANAELRASRTRLVAAADGERRRIERDIHDGAQQHLVALAVELNLLRPVVADRPEAVEALEEMSHAVRQTIQQLRDLAHGIYPPLLAEAGLGEALREAGLRAAPAVSVRVDASLARRPADVETAVYFCCVEAIQNAAKHAAGSQVTVRLWDEPDALRFEVSDSGPGFDPSTVESGHGLRNMADRIGAVGGTLEWRPGGSGATVAGRVPDGAGRIGGAGGTGGAGVGAVTDAAGAAEVAAAPTTTGDGT